MQRQLSRLVTVSAQASGFGCLGSSFRAPGYSRGAYQNSSSVFCRKSRFSVSSTARDWNTSQGDIRPDGKTKVSSGSTNSQPGIRQLSGASGSSNTSGSAVGSGNKWQTIRGAMLYAPPTSLSSPTTLIYDLEDSVKWTEKLAARSRLINFLDSPELWKTRGYSTEANCGNSATSASSRQPTGGWLSVAVRPNSPFTPLDEDPFRLRSLGNGHEGADASEGGIPSESGQELGRNDIQQIWGSEAAARWNGGAGPMMVLPKVHHPAMLTEVDRLLMEARGKRPGKKTPLVASIEFPEAIINVTSIAGWRGGVLKLVGLLFAAEDFCAASRIIRSPDRSELLFARSSIVMAAKAFGLSAIDMVCVDYKDQAILNNESLEGRRLGFDAKQAIHPSQVEPIASAYAPSKTELELAIKILSTMKASSARGAETVDGKMIDMPMVLQARKIVQEAAESGIKVEL